MTEEIKEILYKFDKVLENYELDKKTKSFSVDSICHLFPNEMITIKNYITNLQKENEELLKKLEDVSLDEANIRADILLEQQDYKSRNEKAVEYIKSKKAIINTDYIRIFDLFEIEEQGYTKDLLNILQGGDEE